MAWLRDALQANRALRMWPDPANSAQAFLVANAVEDGRVVLELNADLYPFDGPSPASVLNLLYCSAQLGQPASRDNLLMWLTAHDPSAEVAWSAAFISCSFNLALQGPGAIVGGGDLSTPGIPNRVL